MKTEFEIIGECKVKLMHEQGQQTSAFVNSKFKLEVSKNVDRSIFFNPDGTPNLMGVKALCQCFVQGLIGNIHYGNETKLWNDAEQLRYVIAELERGFVQIPILTREK
jgi:hypothetical protein